VPYRGRWERITTGATYSETLDRLLSRLQVEGKKNGEAMVLAEGKHP